ncbi:hypothetical protein EHP00_2014 [Ecytonucleospora hepatopenaei]|uniref:Uncharacterized protein n=1 Tax=Ecytonucleospora hepatopenaei TaxID=646526 RepID=A0A1W0E977_9MICR|nr:hypothetical protein EHP00_2014 [Ecytonucleospora hepatopenaei]
MFIRNGIALMLNQVINLKQKLSKKGICSGFSKVNSIIFIMRIITNITNITNITTNITTNIIGIIHNILCYIV